MMRFSLYAPGLFRWAGLGGGLAALYALLLGSGAAWLSVPASGPAADATHVVFVVGEREYETERTLPAFARAELEPLGIQTTFVHADPDDPNRFPGLAEALRDADLLFLSVRRRTLPAEQLQAVREYLRSGRPLVAIRTSSHAFALRRGDPPPGHAAWPEFDEEVLGGRYEGHYDNNEGTEVLIRPEAADHPIFRRIRAPVFHSGGTLYRSRDLSPESTVLLYGRAVEDGRDVSEPVAWIHTYEGGRVLYTSLGHPEDFEQQAFRRFLTNAVVWGLGREVSDLGEAANPETGQYMQHFHRQAELGASDYVPPQQALEAFDLPEGVVQDLVAAEPTIHQPVEINFDHRGRLWVVQYNQYPYPEGLEVVGYDYHLRAEFDTVPAPPPAHTLGADRITVLEDTDGDGTFDRAEDVITGLNIATSAVLGRGGIWVLNPPYLLKYPDPDGDGRPDGAPEVHLEGFGLEDTHAVANSLHWGPDGWLYGAQGSTTTACIDSEASKEVCFEGQAIWRYHPETRVFEIFGEGGGNTFHVEFDVKGRLYSGHNGGNARAFHYVQGGYYRKNWGKHGALTNPYALGYIPNMPHTGDEQRFTHAEVVYQDGALPERYRGKLISINPLQSRVIVSRLVPKGSSFETVDVERLVETEDPWYRPVDIKVGPDGAVYVADWYDARLDHVDPRDNWHRASGRIYRIRGADAQPVGPFDLSRLSTDELIELLAHPNEWFRQEALRIFGDRKDLAAVPELRRLVQENTGQLALEALWALNLSGGFDEAFALEALGHGDPHVRMWTVRLLGDRREVSPEAAARLADLARAEPHVEVRSQLAATAGRLPGRDALPVLAGLFTHEEDLGDPHIPLQLWWALESKAERDRTAVLSLFRDAQLWEEPLVQEVLLGRLMQRYVMAGGGENLAAAARLLELSPSEDASQRLVSGLQEALRASDLRLSDMPSRLNEALRAYQERIGQSDLALRLRQGEPGALEEALALVADREADKSRRLAYLEVLAEVRPSPAVPVLLRLLRESDPGSAAIQRAALEGLMGYDDPAIGAAVADAYPHQLQAHPSVRAAALDLLASRRDWALALAEIVEARRVRPEEIPVPIVQQLKRYGDARVEALWPGAEPATSAEKQVQIERVRQILSRGQGTSTGGRPVFAAACGTCHKMHGEGGELGPDLTGYDRDNLDYLVLHTVDPNAYVREGYVTFLVETKDGRTLTGFMTDRSGSSVTLKLLSGQEVAIPGSRIAEMRPLPTSLMPEGLLETLDEQEVRDLFAFLRSEVPPGGGTD